MSLSKTFRIKVQHQFKTREKLKIYWELKTALPILVWRKWILVPQPMEILKIYLRHSKVAKITRSLKLQQITLQQLVAHLQMVFKFFLSKQSRKRSKTLSQFQVKANPRLIWIKILVPDLKQQVAIFQDQQIHLHLSITTIIIVIIMIRHQMQGPIKTLSQLSIEMLKTSNQVKISSWRQILWYPKISRKV